MSSKKRRNARPSVTDLAQVKIDQRHKDHLRLYGSSLLAAGLATGSFLTMGSFGAVAAATGAVLASLYLRQKGTSALYRLQKRDYSPPALAQDALINLTTSSKKQRAISPKQWGQLVHLPDAISQTLSEELQKIIYQGQILLYSHEILLKGAHFAELPAPDYLTASPPQICKQSAVTATDLRSCRDRLAQHPKAQRIFRLLTAEPPLTELPFHHPENMKLISTASLVCYGLSCAASVAGLHAPDIGQDIAGTTLFMAGLTSSLPLIAHQQTRQAEKHLSLIGQTPELEAACRYFKDKKLIAKKRQSALKQRLTQKPQL